MGGGGGSRSGSGSKFNHAARVGSGGSDNLGYGPGSGFSFEPVQTSTNEREIMKNELRKMGVDELKLKNIVTRGLDRLFIYVKRTELFLWNG